jgi:hypothetical protein
MLQNIFSATSNILPPSCSSDGDRLGFPLQLLSLKMKKTILAAARFRFSFGKYIVGEDAY